MPNDHASTDDRTGTGGTPDAHRRRLLALVGGAGVTLLAGCASNVDFGGGAGATGGDAGGATDAASTGTFRLLISDRPVAIDAFDRLDVSFDRARVFRSGGEGTGGGDEGGDGEDDAAVAAASPTATEAANATATESPTPTATETPTPTATESPTPTATESPTATANATADGNATSAEAVEPTEAEPTEVAAVEGEGDDGGDGEQNGFSVIDLGGATVDLTTVVGAKATGIFEGRLPAGRYTKIELYAADVEGVVDDEVVDVTVPSGKLMLTKPFEVAAGATLSFVFDITVVEKGQNGYNLLPVVGESGVAGEDVETEEVQPAAGASDEGTATATETDGTETGATETDENEDGSGDGGQGTGANGPPEGSG